MEKSPAVLALIDESRALSQWISEHHPPTFINEGCNKLAVAAFSIALDHREAILCLLQHGARSSAFALARPVMEAQITGSWASLCATESDWQQAMKGVLPSADSMVRALGKLPDKTKAFSRAKQLAWESLSDYTHGGMRQIGRWLSVEGVAPRHSEADVQGLLAFVDSYALMACVGIAFIAGAESDRYLARQAEVLAAFKGRVAAAKAGQTT